MEKISISQISIQPILARGSLQGFVSFIINNAIHLTSIGIHLKEDGLIALAYPVSKKIHNKYFYTFSPIDSETGKFITETIQKEIDDLGFFKF